MVATHTLDQVSANTSSELKCRYKTGKCYNVRSNKRNGQRHQLCAYHRDKANRIQRKFDRLKRQSERSIRHSMGTNNASATYYPIFPMMNGKVPTFGKLLASDMDSYSDSDSARSSIDSEASDLDMIWNDIPESQFSASCLPEPYPTNVEHDPFVPEEIEFLCNLMLE